MPLGTQAPTLTPNGTDFTFLPHSCWSKAVAHVRLVAKQSRNCASEDAVCTARHADTSGQLCEDFATKLESQVLLLLP